MYGANDIIPYCRLDEVLSIELLNDVTILEQFLQSRRDWSISEYTLTRLSKEALLVLIQYKVINTGTLVECFVTKNMYNLISFLLNNIPIIKRKLRFGKYGITYCLSEICLYTIKYSNINTNAS